MASLGVGEKAVIVLVCELIIYKFAGPFVAGFCLILGLIKQIYAWYKTLQFWKNLGVPCPSGWIGLGHVPQYARKGFHTCSMEWTQKYGKLYGTYLFTKPELVITDGELLKKVLVKDFHVFMDKMSFVMDPSKKSLFSRMAFFLKGDEWKHTRALITPAFTSGKLKGMAQVIANCVQTMCDIIADQTDSAAGVDVDEVIGNMTTDAIGVTAFAMDVNSQRDPNTQFAQYSKEVQKLSFGDWRILFSVVFPWSTSVLEEWFGIRLFLPDVEEYYMKILEDVIKDRRTNPNAKKPDFLQLLVSAVDADSAASNYHLTDRDLIAQSVLFLFAGHGTLASSLSFACYTLAWNQEAQEKAFQEIRKLATLDQSVTYDHIQRGMPYLDAVYSETLRLFPVIPRFGRVCNTDYQLTEHLTIPKGTNICVPIYAAHRNPEVFEDADTFRPERFLKDDTKNIDPFAYIPFGYGQRNCIGMRFVQLLSKVVLSNVLSKFRIVPCAETEPMPPDLDVTLLLKTKKPIRLSFKKREE